MSGIKNVSKKLWINCGTCPYLDKCKSGKSKLNNVPADSPIYNDIGCYDYEQVIPKQMKLFNS